LLDGSVCYARSGLESGMADSRKLAAIMALDVVGYSRLMDEDEAGTARTVGPDECDRKPRSYNGS
jgi:hypothetical protein